MTQEKEMSFLAHLEELRWHLVRSASAIVLMASMVFIFREKVYRYFLLAHLETEFATYRFFCKAFKLIGISSDFCTVTFSDELKSLGPTDQLMNAIWASIILGLIVSFPYILWEFWRFIAPGLSKTEIKKSKGFIVTSSFLFFVGVLFSYYVILPMSVYFFYSFSVAKNVVNEFTLTKYMSLITNTLIGVSLMFELPVIIYFLSKLGLITPMFLKRYRKHALVLVLILSAIITPPDVASQVIVTIPILLLYEVSIIVSKRIYKNQQKNAF